MGESPRKKSARILAQGGVRLQSPQAKLEYMHPPQSRPPRTGSGCRASSSRTPAAGCCGRSAQTIGAMALSRRKKPLRRWPRPSQNSSLSRSVRLRPIRVCAGATAAGRACRGDRQQRCLDAGRRADRRRRCTRDGARRRLALQCLGWPRRRAVLSPGTWTTWSRARCWKPSAWIAIARLWCARAARFTWTAKALCSSPSNACC